MRYSSSDNAVISYPQPDLLTQAISGSASVGFAHVWSVKWKPLKPYRELMYEALLQASPHFRLTLSRIVGYITTAYDDCRDRRSKIDSSVLTDGRHI